MPVHRSLAELLHSQLPRHSFTFSVNGTNPREFAEESTTGFRSNIDLILDDTTEV